MATQYLDVYFHDKHAGIISYQRGQMAFEYTNTYLAQENPMPLSTSMPVQSQLYSHEVAGPFFAGLLPEDIVRKRIARYLGVSEGNTFALLKEIGGECAGAVSVYSQGQSPKHMLSNAYRVLDEKEAFDILTSLDKRPMMVGEGDIRISGAGAQDKLIVAFEEGQLAIPKKNSPSTHIVKPAIKDLTASVENEFFCMKLAKAVKLPVAECEIYTLKGTRYYLVKRFDRLLQKNATIKRLHQEDFCQAMHIPPTQKYENEGGPSLKNCFELLDTHIQAGRMAGVNKLLLLRGVIFNFIIGNGDAHGKNFSLLYIGEAVELAPFYDLLCTLCYDNAYKAKMAMKLGGRYQFKGVSLRHFEKLCQESGFKERFIQKEVIALAKKVQHQAPLLVKSLNSNKATQSDMYDQIQTIIDKQCQKLLRGV